MGGELNLELPSSTPSKEIDISKTQEDINAISGEFKAIVNRDKVKGSFLGMGGWRSIALKDAAKWLSGGTPPKDNADYWGGSIPWISAKSMKGNRFNDSELKLTEAGLKKGSRLAPKNAVLLLVRGSMLHQRIPIGITTKQVAFNQDVKAIIPKDDFLPLYFLYSLSGRERELLDKVENTGIGAGKLDTSVLYQMKIFCPPIEEQKAIAHILGSLDDKIELNRQTNQTLEAMAQALFKSWFVDFDPVIDNALAAGNEIPDALQDRANARKALGDKRKALPEDVRELFPSSFVHSEELGWIPEGWEVKNAEDIATITIGKTPPRKETQWFSDNKNKNFIWVSIRDMGRTSVFIGNSNEYLTPESVKKFNVKIVPKDSVILSFKLTLGRVAITQLELTTNEAIAHFIDPKFYFTKEYIYSYLLNFNYDLLGSTSSIATAVNSKIIKTIPFLVPEENVLKAFKRTNLSWFEKINILIKQTQKLTTIRDTLLPKLISGELRIPEAEKLVEALK